MTELETLKKQNAKLRYALEECWEGEHYEYCGSDCPKDSPDEHKNKYICPSAAHHIRRKWLELENEEE